MLVLSRKIGECIVVDSHIEITLAEIRGSRVKLSFSAPSHIAIVREDAFGAGSGSKEGSRNGHLVLSRKVGERVMISDNIIMTIIKVQGGRVRLGFEAPREVSVVRHEKMPPRNSLQSA